MVDSIDPAARSAVMAKVRGKNTRPELVVRKMLFAAGYRYRLHVRKLPGSPDLVFTSRKKAIFVHGCFWHLHEGCRRARMPKSRCEFWSEKLLGNKYRDEKIMVDLANLGWDVLVVWECELRNIPLLQVRMFEFLNQNNPVGK